MGNGGLLQDRVVLVSGGTSGLGAAIARAAVREGARVVVTVRRRESGEALVAELDAARAGVPGAGAVGAGVPGAGAVGGAKDSDGAAGTRRAGGRVLFAQADVAEVEQARGCVTAAVAAFGRVDCLVNAAGLTSRGTLLDTTPELFDAHVAVNLKAPFFLMQVV